MKQLRNILTGVLLACGLLLPAASVQADSISAAQNGLVAELDSMAQRDDVTPAEQEENTVDVKEIVFGHIGDSYEWHITDFGETKVIIPLPVIVYSGTTGWHVFLSSRLEENGGSYEGLSIAPEGSKYEGKLVEHDAAGNEVRPWDISITKVTLALLINSVLLIVIVLSVARWYRRHPQDSAAPGGFVGFMEMFIMMVNDDVIKSCVGPKYRKFAPYLLTAFFFIFINNLMGLIPVFPGGANVTGNIAITMVLAVCTFLAVNIRNQGILERYFLAGCALVAEGTCPHDAVYRVLRNFYQTVCLDDTSFCQYAGRTHGNAGAYMPDIHIGEYGTCLERFADGSFGAVQYLYERIGIAGGFIQAYVFTMLSAVFIGLAQEEHTEKAGEKKAIK